MSRLKLGATFVSTAALVACVPPTYYADQDDDLDIVCTKEASVASHIKDERCRFTGEIASERGRSERPHDDDPFQTNPVTPQTNPVMPASTDVRTPAEGKCGGAR